MANQETLEPIYDEAAVPKYLLPELTDRSDTLAQFAEHVYGAFPPTLPKQEAVLVEEERNALHGLAVRRQLKVRLWKGNRTAEFGILLYTPAKTDGPVPVFLGLNFNGNHTIHQDPAILLPDSWCPNNDQFGVTANRASEKGRGLRASRWPVEQLVRRGYGLATIYHGDIAPDTPDRVEEGLLQFFPDSPARGGAIAAWAWGLSRALDALLPLSDVDRHRVAVIGHSRLGKAALWAGANDERFRIVISNNSGCGGAALFRRRFGERVAHITRNFPHWFTEKFRTYNEREAFLPVDQHQLLALVAPRALYVASAKEDKWADPYGEYLSLAAAAPSWGIHLPTGSPEVNRPLVKGKLGYHIRSGTHDIQEYDWREYVRFADSMLR